MCVPTVRAAPRLLPPPPLPSLGAISPERVVYDWSLCVTTAHNRVPQDTKYVPVTGAAAGGGGVDVVPTLEQERASGPLTGTPGLIDALVNAGHAIAGSRRAPQDIEWCWDGARLCVVQVRRAVALGEGGRGMGAIV
jgi:hypothetical protein